MHQTTTARKAMKIYNQLTSALMPMVDNNTIPDQVAIAMTRLEIFVNELNGHTEAELRAAPRTIPKRN